MPSRESIEEQRVLRQRVLAGDQIAWRTLYDGAFEDLWRYVLWRCAGLRDRAEEVTQETWLVAVRRIADFDPGEARFATWLRGIAAHVLHNDLRARRRSERGRQPGPSIEPACEETERCEQAELIAMALAELPAHYEAVLRAKYLDLASVEQIAAESLQSAKAIESQLTRARRAFRTAYERLAGSDVVLTEEEP